MTGSEDIFFYFTESPSTFSVAQVSEVFFPKRFLKSLIIRVIRQTSPTSYEVNHNIMNFDLKKVFEKYANHGSRPCTQVLRKGKNNIFSIYYKICIYLSALRIGRLYHINRSASLKRAGTEELFFAQFACCLCRIMSNCFFYL